MGLRQRRSFYVHANTSMFKIFVPLSFKIMTTTSKKFSLPSYRYQLADKEEKVFIHVGVVEFLS